MPNITGKIYAGDSNGRWGLISDSTGNTQDGVFYTETGEGWSQSVSTGKAGASGPTYFSANKSSTVYQNGAPVQQRATQMYLYFYVGQFTQSATEQTAGLNAELFNQKVDKSDMVEVQCVVETYSNGTDWYRIYSDGWCEQGGKVTLSASTYTDINLLKPYIDTDYSCFQSHNYAGTGGQAESYILPIDESSLRVGNSCGNSQTFCWKAEGYIS